MNIAQILIHAIRHYGADIEILHTDNLRLHNTERLPVHLIDLARTYKPQIVRYMQEKSVYELLESIQQDGAEIQIIDHQNLRLHHTDMLTQSQLAKIKQYKSEIINLFSYRTINPNNQNEAITCEYIQYEAIQTYKDRLELHRNNLRKNRHPAKNAMITPKQLIEDLMTKYILNHDQAQQIITNMAQQNIFYYDSNARLYIFTNEQHQALQPLNTFNSSDHNA